mmetsp:Transcript_100635/g.289146  ORF Transcript_100635/g.289146 Transcript_100635/m.289146 type:complete len:216 (-) Transcript_100635:27-674(-)
MWHLERANDPRRVVPRAVVDAANRLSDAGDDHLLRLLRGPAHRHILLELDTEKQALVWWRRALERHVHTHLPTAGLAQEVLAIVETIRAGLRRGTGGRVEEKVSPLGALGFEREWLLGVAIVQAAGRVHGDLGMGVRRHGQVPELARFNLQVGLVIGGDDPGGRSPEGLRKLPSEDDEGRISRILPRADLERLLHHRTRTPGRTLASGHRRAPVA